MARREGEMKNVVDDPRRTRGSQRQSSGGASAGSGGGSRNNISINGDGNGGGGGGGGGLAAFVNAIVGGGGGGNASSDLHVPLVEDYDEYDEDDDRARTSMSTTTRQYQNGRSSSVIAQGEGRSTSHSVEEIAAVCGGFRIDQQQPRITAEFGAELAPSREEYDSNCSSSIDNSVDRAEDGFIPQVLSLGRFHDRTYSRWEKLLLLLAALQGTAFLVSRVWVFVVGPANLGFMPVDQAGYDGRAHSIFMLVVMAHNVMWELSFLIVALLTQNHLDLFAFFTAVVMLFAHAVAEIVVASKVFVPIIFMIVSFCFVTVLVAPTIRVYRDIQSVRTFRMFQKVHRKRNLLDIYKRYLLVVTALKIDAFLGATLIISGMFGHIWYSDGYAQYSVPAGYVCTVVGFICCVVACRLERLGLLWIFYAIASLEPGYIIYKMLMWQTTLPPDPQRPLSKPYFFFISAVALAVRIGITLLVNSYTKSFGKGLREHVFVRTAVPPITPADSAA